jgi:alkylation response protein AidB-like acyl-CoA dehydrogenase
MTATSAPPATATPDPPAAAAAAVGVAGFARRVAEALREAEAFSPRRVAELDRAEEFPDEVCRLLDALGVPAWYVPERFGGALTDHSGLVRLMREVAGRDLTAAVAHAKTFLGAACVFVAAQRPGAAPGDLALARWLGAQVRAGLVVSWGLTEREHGSDLLAGELTATPDAGGYRLRGAKWLINNATRSDAICLLARTSPGGGARGYSLLLVDKRRLAPGSYRCLPKVPTHGIRGADISGIEFTDALVPADALVGQPGEGLETVLKALQLTRTVATALSLGAADHALRLTVGYVTRRELYSQRLVELPHVRRTLGGVAAGLFVAESLALFGARAAHALPAEMSVYSAVAKAFLPALVDELVAECGELLGARAFLTDVYEHGAFQKLQRDHRIVGIFDGNMFVNRSALISHFPRLAGGWHRQVRQEDRVWLAADLHAPLPEPGALELFSRDGCSLTQSLPSIVDRMRDAGAPPPVMDLAGQILAQCERLHAELAALPPQGVAASAEAFALAYRYELCVAAAAATAVWVANRHRYRQPWWRGALWLEAALTLLADRLAPPGHRPDPRALDRLAGCLTEGAGWGPSRQASWAADRPIGLEAGAELGAEPDAEQGAELSAEPGAAGGAR